MATLQKIRQRGVFLTVIIGLALLAFIIGGIDFNSIFGKSRTVVAKVDGDEIDIREYEKRIDEMTAFYKIESGQNSLSDQYVNQVRNSVWNSWLTEKILGEQCKKLGIVVSDDELADRLTGSNPHPMLNQLRAFYNPETGGFDKNAFIQFISQIGTESNAENEDYVKYWSFIQRTIREQILEEKYNTLVGASFQINDIDAKYAYEAKKAFNIEFVQTPYSTLPDSTFSVSDNEIKDRYNKEKNNFYKEDESREIGMITFAIQPSQKDFEDIKTWIEGLQNEFATSADYIALANQNSDVSYTGIPVSKSEIDPDLLDFAFNGKAGDFYAPQLKGRTYKMARLVETGIMASDSVKARHILIMESSKEKTQALADSLTAALKSGSDFATTAKTFSKAGTAQNGGELGWFRDGDLDKDFSAVCIKPHVNELFQSPMGQAIPIIQVTEKTKPVSKVKICVLARDVEASSSTYGTIYNQASQYVAKNTNQADFEKNADPSKGEFLRTYTVTKNDNIIADLKDSRQIIRWAFEKDLGDVAENVFECGDKFAVVTLKSITESGNQSIDAVKDHIKSEIIKEKKSEKIVADMKTRLGSSQDLSVLGAPQVATNVSMSSNYIQNLGSEPKMLAELASTVNQKDLKFFQGANSTIAAKVTEVIPSQTEFDAKVEINQLSMRRPYQYMLFESLKSSSDITDNRINFY